jgi:ubiquitin-protein ligase
MFQVPIILMTSLISPLPQDDIFVGFFPCMLPHFDLSKLQEWHCTLRGSPGTEFEGGLYHFRILLPSEYPFRPPSIVMLTPNGRFELNTKVCVPILILGAV